MKILFHGAGVLGTLYAAKLHDAGHNVSILARNQCLAAEVSMTGHANAARDEMKLVAEEFLALVRSTAVLTPAIGRLCSCFELPLPTNSQRDSS